ncbi:MAG: PIG-L family deacetylase [Candidatus Omnitrophota bacterium]
MLKVLSLCGHLDDSVIAIGGTIRKIVNAGGEVSVVCFGNGSEGYSDLKDKEKIVEVFTREARISNEVLGVKNFECLGYGDFDVLANAETYKLAIKAIRKYQPDIIFTHYWKEYFQHRNTARLVTDAWWQAEWKASLALGEPWKAKKLYYFEVIHLLNRPTHIVDVTDTFEVKIKAWKTFACQQESLDQLAEQLEARARFYGSLIGVKYGEALKLSDYIPQAIRRVSEL